MNTSQKETFILFDNNDIRYSEFGFLLEGQSFTENYIDKVYKAGLDLISLENKNSSVENHIYANYVHSINSILKQNLIKSTFIFIISNYENDIFRFIRKYKSLKEGELPPPNRNALKANLNLIKRLLDTENFDYAEELSVLEKIRHIIIHRNGKLLDNERMLKNRELIFNNVNVFNIDEISLNISMDENIIFYTHEIIGKFYEDLINKALISLNMQIWKTQK